MSNGHANCIFAVCCPPESDARVEALAEEMAGALSKPSDDTYEDIARWVLTTYDLAPKGALTPLYTEIARLAREGHVKVEPQNEVQG